MTVNSILSNVVKLVAAVLICTLHFGTSKFVSVQFFVFIVLVLDRLALFTARSTPIRPLIIFVLYLVIFVPLTMLAASDRQGHWLTFAFREGLGIWVVQSVSVQKRLPGGDRVLDFPKILASGLTLALVMNAALGALQLLDVQFLHTGKFFVPSTFYSLDYGTLSDDLNQKFDKLFIRPSGFYSEPSALAALGVLGFFASADPTKRLRRIASLMCIMLSFSLSGIAAFVLIYLYQLISRRDRNLKSVAIALGSLLVVGSVLVAMNADRISKIGKLSDESTDERIVAPVSFAATSLATYPLGLDLDTARSLEQAKYGQHGMDNWFLRTLIQYGWLGPLLWVLAFSPLTMGEKILFAVLGNFNGELFFYDRAVLLSAAITASRPKKNSPVQAIRQRISGSGNADRPEAPLRPGAPS